MSEVKPSSDRREAIRQLEVRQAIYKMIADKVMILRAMGSAEWLHSHRRTEDSLSVFRPCWNDGCLLYDGWDSYAHVAYPFTRHNGGLTDENINAYSGETLG